MNRHFSLTMRLLFCLVSLLPINQTKAQPAESTAYDLQYFRPPMDIPLLLSGTFGELRTNHFHSGIDIKTNGKEGLNVFAIADGFVSRIRVSPYGYGLAVYIDHPNGYTSVYGHLQKFNPALSQYVKQSQYALHSAEVDLYPEAGAWEVKKGDIIAFSGNSGGSSGPHLHFEIRETESEIPINPMLFGFDIQDNIAPVLEGVSLHSMTDWTDNKNIGTWTLEKAKTVYKPRGTDTLYSPHKTVGIGIKCFDRLTGASNKNGVAKIIVSANEDTIFLADFNKIAFHESRYINALIDYAEYKRSKRRYMQCFVLPGNQLGVYRQTINRGYITLPGQGAVAVEVAIEDFKGNSSKAQFFVKYEEGVSKKILTNPVIASPYERFAFSREGVEISWESGALYDSLAFDFAMKPIAQGDYSPSYAIHHSHTPLHKSLDIAIRAGNLPEPYFSKALIGIDRGSGQASSIGGSYADGWVKSTSRYFGEFAIMLDTLPPTIERLNISNNKNMTTESAIRCRIKDDFSGIRSYWPTIDGQWILMPYNAKTKTVSHIFENAPDGKEHIFELVVEDEKGNQSSIKIQYTR